VISVPILLDLADGLNDAIVLVSVLLLGRESLVILAVALMLLELATKKESVIRSRFYFFLTPASVISPLNKFVSCSAFPAFNKVSLFRTGFNQ
jgi:hypothetical protein